MLLATLIPSRPRYACRGLCCPKLDLGKPELGLRRMAGSAPHPVLHPHPWLPHLLVVSQGHFLSCLPMITMSP